MEEDENVGYKLAIDGSWTLFDLYEFIHTYVQSYSFLYSLFSDNLSDVEKIHITYVSHPWIGGYSALNFYNHLYWNIPNKHKPGIIAIRYSSPGYIELGLVIAVAISLRKIISAFASSVKELNSAYNEIYKGLQERKLLKINVKMEELKLEKQELDFIKESTKTLSELMGFEYVNAVNKNTNNPLATLKIILSFYRRVKKLFDFEKKGKVKY